MADELSTEPVETDVETDAPEQDSELDSVELDPEDLAEDAGLEAELGEADEDEEEESEEPAESKEESTEESEEDNTEEEEEAQPESDQDIKERNRLAAQARIQEKQQREQDIKDQQAQYVAEADPDDPRDAAVRQLQVDAYNTKVERHTNTLTNAYNKAVQDFPILNSDDPAVRAEVDAALDLFEKGYIKMDTYNNPDEVRGDLYQFLQTKADSIEKLSSRGVREQEKSKSKEKSKTFTPPSKTPKEPKVDPDLEAFDEEAGKY